MARIKIELTAPPLDGMDVKFKAPCDCTEVTGILVSYPAADGNTAEQEFTFRDCHGANLAGIGNLFAAGAYVKAILDTNRGHAYLQNADCNAYLNSAIFGTYTHDGANLTGCGGNGKFKATATTTISTIKVNGVDCSVKCGEESSMDLIAGCWYTFILDGNTVNFNAGGAGGGLAFKVVGGTDAPASPSEGTIWVNTDTPITAYEFSATVPENPVEGMVWVETGVTSPVAFNALKKNGVIVYPISVQQHIGGVWVDQTARSHQNGVWIDWWNGELYEAGNEFENITGGWALSEVYSTSHGDTLIKNENNMVFSSAANSGSNGYGFLRANNKQDLTNIKTLYLVAEASIAQYSRCAFCASSVDSGSTAYDSAAAKTELTTVPAETVISLDVSGLSGLYYVGVAFGSADDWGTSTVTVEKIRME